MLHTWMCNRIPTDLEINIHDNSTAMANFRMFRMSRMFSDMILFFYFLHSICIFIQFYLYVYICTAITLDILTF